MAQNNNRYWKNIENPGKPPLYDGEALWDKFKEYIQDNDTRVWLKPDFIKSGPGAGQTVNIEVPNPPSITGFCCFAAITPQTFNNYRKNGAKQFESAHMIASIIQTIQVDGAVTNIFNANIVARIANLIDRKEVDIKTDLTDDERADAIKKILENAPVKGKGIYDELM